jgi:hypothetical protein
MRTLACLTVLVIVLASFPKPILPTQQVIHVDFEAVIREIDDPMWYAPPTWEVGDTLAGYYQYELGAVDLEPDSTEGFYRHFSPPSCLVVSLKGYTYSTDPVLTNVIVHVYDSLIDDLGRFWDGFSFHSQTNLLDPLVLGIGAGPIHFEFWDTTGTALPNDSLPVNPPSVGAWTRSAGMVISGEESYFIFADLISCSVGTPTGIPGIPDPSFVLRQNYPNPFELSTSISFRITRASDVRVSIYDVSGKRVTALLDAPLTPREYSVVWDGLDSHGRKVASGIYLYRLEAGGLSQTRKMVILRQRG